MDEIYSFLFELRNNVYDYLWLLMLVSAVIMLGIFIFCFLFNSKNKKNKTYLDLIKIKSPKAYKKLTSNKNFKKIFRVTLIVISIFITIVYILWRLFVSLPISIGWVAVFLSLILLVVEISEFIDSYVVGINHLFVNDYPCPKVADKDLEDVDVFVCTYNEPVELLFKTLNACVHLKYPNKDKVHIYLLDDKNRTAMKKLADRLGVNYISRKKNTNAKAGNLNNALSKTSSPYVVTFDADMIPKSDFLLKTIPYFSDAKAINKNLGDDKKVEIGFVQTPQHFYHPDLFQQSFNASDKMVSEQDFFHKAIQKGKTYSNSVYCCGTNCVFNRNALEEVGGFYPNSITEDIATGLLIQNAGYVSLCTTEVLAQGMNPTSFSDLIIQRRRWACGCTTTCSQFKGLKKNMSLLQRMSFNSVKSFWYYPYKSIVVLLLPIVTALFSLFIFQCDLIDLLIFWGITYLIKTLTWTTLNSRRQSYIMDKVAHLGTSFSLIIPLTKEILGLKDKEFRVTKKTTSDKPKTSTVLIQVCPFFVVFVLSVLSLLLILMNAAKTQEWSLLILGFWLLYNVFFMIICVYLVMSDDEIRQSTVSRDVYNVCLSRSGKNEIQATTKKISETFIDLKFDCIQDFSIDDKFEISFESMDKENNIKLICAEKFKDGTYRFNLDKKSLQNPEYLALIYDSKTDMPDKNSPFCFLIILWRCLVCRLLNVRPKNLRDY